MKKYRLPHYNHKGFTIIELLIATTVLSVIILLVTLMMINIGHLYYKGVNQAGIQDGVRSVSDDISQHLQLSDVPLKTAGPAADGTQAFCISSVRYTYILNKEIGVDSPHVLWRDTNPTPGDCVTSVGFLNAPPAGSNGTELAPPGSILTYFTISPSAPYVISIGMAFGDTTTGLLNLSGLSTRCVGGVGDQFCGTATLITTVGTRISGAGS